MVRAQPGINYYSKLLFFLFSPKTPPKVDPHAPISGAGIIFLINMNEVQRITVYGVKQGITENQVKKYAAIDGTDAKAERDLTKAILQVLKDKTTNVITLRRTYVSEDQAN